MTAKPTKRKGFTVKQQRFIDSYDGNATKAAIKAGYSKKTAHRIGAENMQKHAILNAILTREKKRSESEIANRQERQEFWTAMFRGKTTTKIATGKGDDKAVEEIQPAFTDRLKASELLGRSEADFTDKIQPVGGGKPIDVAVTLTLEEATRLYLENLR